MRSPYTVDEAGNPVPVAPEDVEEWKEWYARTDHTIAYDYIDGIEVTTTFLGYDRAPVSCSPPLLWVTSVGSGFPPAAFQLWTSQTNALRGHAHAVGALHAARRGLPLEKPQHDRTPPLEALRGPSRPLPRYDR